MNFYCVELECFTGAHTNTYVGAKDEKSAIKIAESRVNKKSPNGWKAIGVSREYMPDVMVDNWNK